VSKIYAVIMCGGLGTRLWPLSRRDFPKQFAITKDGKSLFQRTFERAVGLGPEKTICVAHKNYRFLLANTIGEDRERNLLLLEPEPRNTTAAIASAALHVANTNPDAILAFMPADHEIGSYVTFAKSVLAAARIASRGWITILGVTPTYAATSYGYIRPGKPVGDKAWSVDRFVEKPDEMTAKDYCRNGFLWNSGLVVARADVLIAALSQHSPEVLSACREALKNGTVEVGLLKLDREAFLSSPSISFDYSVLEKHDHLAVVEFDGEWSDVGTWAELARLSPKDAVGNRVGGEARLLFCENVFTHSSDRLMVGLGLRDMVIVDSPDALLVASGSHLGELRKVVGTLNAENRAEVINHRKVERPWGWFESINRGANFQVKLIAVKPGGVLSLQYHHHRAEHWVVVKGTAFVTCGEREFILKENESTYIPQGAVHRLENRGSELLELIEVQTGTYLGDDDIVRLEDTYGRAKESNSAAAAP
jgi:mannose-1-phosphate guanylyltransferase/mannose-6-phosphate isomerase